MTDETTASNREKAIGYSGKVAVNAACVLLSYAGYVAFGEAAGLTLLAVYILLFGMGLQEKAGWNND